MSFIDSVIVFILVVALIYITPYIIVLSILIWLQISVFIKIKKIFQNLAERFFKGMIIPKGIYSLKFR